MMHIRLLKCEAYHIARATKDYKWNDSNQLSFRQNDLLLVLEEKEGGMCIGELLETGVQGLFPMSIVKLLNDAEKERVKVELKINIPSLKHNKHSRSHSSAEYLARKTLGKVDKEEEIEKLSSFFGESSESISAVGAKKIREKVKFLFVTCVDRCQG